MLTAKQFNEEIAAGMNRCLVGLNRRQIIQVLDAFSRSIGGPGVVAARRKPMITRSSTPQQVTKGGGKGQKGCKAPAYKNAKVRRIVPRRQQNR